MVTLAAWVGLPLVLYLTSAGLGLLAERAARVELPDALLAPLGGCLAIVVSLAVLQLGGAGAAMGIALVAPALAGLVLSREGLPRRLLPGWAGVASLLVLTLYLAPVVLSGHWNWLGYNFVNDTAINFVTVDHLIEHGSTKLPDTTALLSTRVHTVNGTVDAGYPLGVHAWLAALDWLVPAPVEAVYQPFIASVAALAAMALAWLASSLRVPRPLAAAAASVALGAAVTYHYALHGAFKELAMVLVVAAAATLSRWALDQRMPIGAGALVGAALAAAIAIFSAGAAAYALSLGGVLVVTIALERPRQRLGSVTRSAAIATVALLVAVSPFWLDALSFSRDASAVFADTGQDFAAPLNSPAVLGHLARPLPLFQSLGIYLRDDYRYGIEPGLANTLTIILLVGAGLLVVWAVVAEVRGRRIGVLLALAPALLVYLLSRPRLEPYAEAKLLVVLSPMVVFAAALGAWWLYRRSWIAGIVASVALVGGVVVTDAMAYRDARLAPIERLTALRDAAEHAKAPGQYLLPEWEEFAKHFGDPVALNVGSESFSPRPVLLRDASRPIFNRSFDLDEMQLDYVESWAGIILRRSPERSRPPADYELAYTNAYYEVWERRERPRIYEHLPLQHALQPTDTPRCADVLALARRVRGDQRLLAAQRPEVASIGMTDPPLGDADSADRLPSWAPSADVPGGIVPTGQGRVAGKVKVPAGRYRVWVKGSTGGRPMTVTVDGRPAGSVKEINTPGQWIAFDELDLEGGTHTLELFRPGGGLEPGNSVDGLLVAIALEPRSPSRLVELKPSGADRLCGRSWDWIERVGG